MRLTSPICPICRAAALCFALMVMFPAGPADAISDDDPTARREQILMAQIHTASGRYAQAAEILERLLAGDTANTVLRMDLAYDYNQMGLWSKALDVYDQVLAADPDHPQARLIRTLMLLTYGERAEYEFGRRRFGDETKDGHRFGVYEPLPEQTYVKASADLNEYRAGNTFLQKYVRDHPRSLRLEYGALRRRPYAYSLRLGMADAFSDSPTVVSAGGTLTAHPDDRREYSASVDFNRPWDDPAAAHLADGRYDAYRLGGAYTLRGQHFLNLAAEHRDYEIHRNKKYGTGNLYEAMLGRRKYMTRGNAAGQADYLGWALGYYGVRHSYRAEYEKTVALAKKVNQFSVNILCGVRIFPGWFFEGSAFVLHDPSRHIRLFSLDAYGYQATASGFLSDRTRLEATYYLSTESTVTGSGKYREIRTAVRYNP